MSDPSSELSPRNHEVSLVQPPGKLYERSVVGVVTAELQEIRHIRKKILRPEVGPASRRSIRVRNI